MTGAPLLIHRATVLPAWLDYNGHMNDANYLMVFGYGLDLFMDRVGIGEEDRKTHEISLYTMQAHLSYVSELHANEPIRVETRVLDFDQKRVVLYYEMFREEALAAGPVAACESMNLHVSTAPVVKSAAFRPESFAAISALADAAKALPPAKYAGRPIAIPRKAAAS
ncbi:MAG: thioesterase family protein [Dongiaceae bacterium]